MRPVVVSFEYENEKGVQKYHKVIEYPEQAPVPFAAICAFAYYVFWQEKMALKRRIEQLEAWCTESGISIPEPTEKE